jgi:polyisoprenoid-binding protein YceI
MTAKQWDFDLVHSSINFHVRHLMVSKVHGQFHKWGGTLVIDDQDITKSKVDISIETASVDTKDTKRDEHLRSADFLEVDKFPTMTFKSTAVEAHGPDELHVTGDLTIHGITKPVKLTVERGGEVKDPWGGTRTGFSAKTTISRKDHGLEWNVLLEAGGFVVGDKIEIGLEIEAILAVAKAA